MKNFKKILATALASVLMLGLTLPLANANAKSTHHYMYSEKEIKHARNKARVNHLKATHTKNLEKINRIKRHMINHQKNLAKIKREEHHIVAHRYNHAKYLRNLKHTKHHINNMIVWDQRQMMDLAQQISYEDNQIDKFFNHMEKNFDQFFTPSKFEDNLMNLKNDKGNHYYSHFSEYKYSKNDSQPTNYFTSDSYNNNGQKSSYYDDNGKYSAEPNQITQSEIKQLNNQISYANNESQQFQQSFDKLFSNF